MRIDHLEIENFKKFAKQSLDLDPHFTLLIGDNGSGKTSVLDALAVAASIWLVVPPDSALGNSSRDILPSEIHLEAQERGDRIQFHERLPIIVRATGWINKQLRTTWSREFDGRQHKLVPPGALQSIAGLYTRDVDGLQLLFPVLAYYGAGRAWLASNEPMPTARRPNGPARRWAAFYECFNERIRFDELREWFRRETTAAGLRAGRMRPGFEVVRRAVLRCVPDADDIWFDPDREQIVLSIQGNAQPFDNLSAGQRMMLALIADLAIKAVTQNAFLLHPDELGPEDEPLPRVLKETPGMVLIDELDVHLHPKWQRRVATDLKETFPNIQFVCTSHSPQIIGELKSHEIRLLDEDVTIPPRSFGIDSSRILEEVMGTTPRNQPVEELLRQVSKFINQEDFDAARKVLAEVEAKLGPNDPEITRARTLMTFLESKA